MFKRFLYTIGTMAMMLLVFAACQDHDVSSSTSQQDVPEGYVAISFKLDIPDMREVQVRAVDPDGVDIHNLALYCFNTYGLYIGKVEVENMTTVTGTSGKFSATIPEDTHIIHFLANQNTALYDDDELRGKSEEEVMAAMEGASGMLIFWGRVQHNSQYADLATQIEEMSIGDNAKGVQMIRNQAMVTTTIGKQTYTDGSFTVTGFRTANIHAFGTVAPFCPTHGFNMTEWPCNDANGNGFVTLPVNKAMMSDIIEVNTKAEDYVFEHENTLDNPVSVIIRGCHENETQATQKYYRVLLLDENGNQLLIRRNHKYTIQIVGDLSYGQNSFAEAMKAPATNNVFISVADWVNEVSDANYTLSVEKTSVVLNANDLTNNQVLELNYTLEGKGGTTITTSDKPEVTWLDGNTVAYNEFAENFTVNGNVGEGTVGITLRNMSDASQHVGTLMIRKGRLYRTIEVVVIRTQTFTPSWISAQVQGEVGSSDDSRAHVTLKFTIPETCPESLYPFPVLISVNSLDVRSEAGDALPVVIKGDPQYFGTDYDGIEYKYVYTVNAPGVHRVYFENILSHDENQTQNVYLEANYFETLTKSVVYAEHNRTINLPSLSTWQDTSGGNNPTDEFVFYKLVPQKINAPVELNLTLKDGSNTVAVGTNDEFMLYSKTLDFADNGSNFKHIVFNENQWSTNGRVQLFYPDNATQNSGGGYSLSLKTNTSRSADVVRIASNHTNSLDRNGNAYTGNSYRDIIFELANYRPFGFAATVETPVDTYGNADQEYAIDETSSFVEEVVPVSLTYQPDQEVTVSFDVMSFTASDNAEVSPFGEAFEIYIDAPMLELADNQTGVTYENGRFVYRVAANATDSRVTVNFKKTGICTVGDIVISSNEDKVVFYKKTFHVTNQQMTGTIQYRETVTSTLTNVPKDAFVAFIRTKTNARIGVMTITADGEYSVSLRSEYEFDWDDAIELDYMVGEDVYECNTINNGTTDVPLTLNSLYTYKNVVLTKL